MGDASWRWDDVDGVKLLRCAPLDGIPRVAHAFSSRIASGDAGFDLGPADGGQPAIRERRARFAAASGWGDAPLAILRQVHGADLVSAAGLSQDPPAADGVIADGARGRTTPIPAVRTADCVAILLADSRGRVLGALHGGWRGLARGIAARAVSRFGTAGARPEDLVAALGPAILSCCYEVGAEVVAALGGTCGPPAGYVRQSRSGRTSVDLHAAAAAQLAAAGVPPAAIHAAPYCTRCRNDLFFSFRAEGAGAGRLMAGIGPAASP